MSERWTVFLRAPDLGREGQIDDFQTLECIERFNAVGTWELDLDARTRHAGKLLTPGYGVEVVRDDGEVIMSGPLDARKRKKTIGANRLTVYGFDDNVWLRRRRAHPEPGTAAPPYSLSAYDVRTGTASTVLRQYVDVNAGAGAGLRQVAGLDLDIDPLLGSAVTGRGRWQPLLEVLQELALAGGIGFRIRKAGTGLLFTVYQPEDKSATVVFSEERGNLLEFDYEVTAPVVNYAYLGGGGEETARAIEEYSDADEIDAWGRIEDFVDRRDTTDPAELDQEGAKTLAEGASTTGLSITPIDTPGQRFRTHYDLGTRVSVVIDGEPVQELVREVKTRLTPAGPQSVSPTIGTVSRTGILRILDRLRAAQSRLTNLERR